MSTYMSYNMKGKKEEFANWVSDISPEYTPFVSMLTKFPVKNTEFQWQVDELAAVNAANSFAEGSAADAIALSATTVISNFTQIMRKVVMVSDTANAVSSHGREKELFYQLKKAAKEIKRDQEAIFLSDQTKLSGIGGAAAKTAALGAQIDASLKLEIKADLSDFETQLFALTTLLYTEGAEPNIIMYSPVIAGAFADLQETATGSRQRIFENDKRFVKQVEVIIDPLGQEFKCVPNRWCPVGVAYILNMKDVSMAVLRAPKQEKLAKIGSAEKYMIEMETGLRLNNPKAAGVLTVATA